MEELFKLIGLGVPFSLGAATYAVFAWLDNNASDEATNVISLWLHGRSQHKPDLGNLIIKAFDRIYTSPLLTFRAFRRSAAISSIIWLLLYVPWLVYYNLFIDIDAASIVRWSTSLIANVLSDYLSLFLVRKCLNLARTYPITASVTAAAAGALIVIISFIISFVTVEILTHWIDPFQLLPLGFEMAALLPYIGSALIIHLWLPLFAIPSLAVRLAFWIFGAVEWAQWFLKQGEAHPFRAIGVVATVIVFGSAMAVKEGWALLGFLELS